MFIRVDVSLLEKETAKISSQRQFQSIRARNNLSPQTFKNRQSAKEKFRKKVMLHVNIKTYDTIFI